VSNATKLHCIGIINVDTGERRSYRPDQIDQGLEDLDRADVLIGHNIKRHDIPLMKKLKNWQPRAGVQIKDTMVIARTIFPNVKATDKELVFKGKMPGGKEYQGKHTIAAWGHRLGCPKGDYAKVRRAQAIEKGLTEEADILAFVWGEWNEDMHSYMMQDCETNLALWKSFPENYSSDALDLEHRIARVCDAMEQAGVPFDLQAAGSLQAELKDKQTELERVLKQRYGYWYAPVSPDPTKALFVPKRDNKKLGYVAGQECTKIKQVEFNPGSRDHIARVLMRDGWTPTKYTDGGKPQIDEEVIEQIIAQFPEMGGLGELLMVEKRLSQLCGTDNSLMQSVKETGNIHGVINPMGTITSRAAHMYPNLGQVPSAKKPYGPRFRTLFYAPPGWRIVGADQQGLELRGLAHYLKPLDGGNYEKVVLEGDPHWLHCQVMGLAAGDRDKHNHLHTIVREDGAKRFIYAYIYGAGDVMVGSIIYECLLNARRNGGPEGEYLYKQFFKNDVAGENTLRSVGKKIRTDFAQRIPGFAELKEKISRQVEAKGRIVGLDGRLIPIRSDHSALNFMIQSAGAIICKRWVSDAFEECDRRFHYNWDKPWEGQHVFCLWVHDETQVWVRKGLEEEIGNILVATARTAGEPYGFRVPLDSEASYGPNWAATH
jgi:DNA polymerase-1